MTNNFGVKPFRIRERIKKTHEDSKIAIEYLMIADLMEMYFKEEY